MKNLSFLIFIIFIFSCADIKENTVTTVFKKCDCEKTIKTDSVFYATNVTLKKDIKQKMIVFNCATIEIAIASVSDVNGNNEHCENLFDIKCTSNSKEQLKLNSNFTYFSENKQNMDGTKEGSQQLFFHDLQSKGQNYFECNVNSDREITTISKLTIK